ncbi:MAG: nucleotidyltransferase domain-containing protein [Candidatus Burarchaeum sp.]|nr:nucleotidyltransferase domain-containing protein [Candidatus Burarchaeum sp.]MDO8340248.1 nucleotidyltransferase domain-containing protein [Candidatus Burarchaeum sp.]
MITKDNNYKVMKLFFDAPEKKFHLRQMARLTHLSAPGVSKIVARLKKEGLLVSERGGLVENVSAARSGRFRHLKTCYNQLAIHDSGLVDFLRDEYEEPAAIILYGSFACGEDTSKSDIDIAIVTGKSKALGLKKFEARLGRKLNIYEIKIKECSKEFLNNLANGIALCGYLKLIE